MTKLFQSLVLFIVLTAPAWGTESKLVASDAQYMDQLGWSVAISGDYAIAGAYYESDGGTYAGAAYIFFNNGSTWSQQAKLTASDPADYDNFGHSVAISGDYAIVGAPIEDPGGLTSAGSAYIFIRSGTSWSQQAKITASDAVGSEQFGYSVAISGDDVLVGAINAGTGGAAYLFQRSGTSWSEERKIMASDAESSDSFGYSVALSGDYAVVGAYKEDAGGSNAGAAYTFYRDQGGADLWGQQTKLTASDAQASDYFGCSVSISGDYALVGAYGEDTGGGTSGAAYVYLRSGTSWSQQTKLMASDPEGNDYFGFSVAISGTYAIIGAYYEDEGASNGGAMYSYLRTGTTWTQKSKTTASDAQGDDKFGYAVAVDGDYVISGAPDEDTGGSRAGAVYIYQSGSDLSLPVTLSSFSAKVEDNGGIQLTWVTESEFENLGFILERCSGSQGWQEIASYLTHEDLKGQGSENQQTCYTFTDKHVEAGEVYDYRLADVSFTGAKEYFTQMVVGIQAEENLPSAFAFYQNYPNPFNPTTTMSYSLPEPSKVSLMIYDIRGQGVITLENGVKTPGNYDVQWNGVDQSGNPVSTGVYFCRLETGAFSKTIKMVYLR